MSNKHQRVCRRSQADQQPRELAGFWAASEARGDDQKANMMQDARLTCSLEKTSSLTAKLSTTCAAHARCKHDKHSKHSRCRYRNVSWAEHDGQENPAPPPQSRHYPRLLAQSQGHGDRFLQEQTSVSSKSLTIKTYQKSSQHVQRRPATAFRDAAATCRPHARFGDKLASGANLRYHLLCFQ